MGLTLSLASIGLGLGLGPSSDLQVHQLVLLTKDGKFAAGSLRFRTSGNSLAQEAILELPWLPHRAAGCILAPGPAGSGPMLQIRTPSGANGLDVSTGTNLSARYRGAFARVSVGLSRHQLTAEGLLSSGDPTDVPSPFLQLDGGVHRDAVKAALNRPSIRTYGLHWGAILQITTKQPPGGVELIETTRERCVRSVINPQPQQTPSSGS